MVDPQNTPVRQRPGVVTISTYLLLLFAICQLISVVVTLATIGTVRDVMDEAYRGTSVEGAENLADVAVVFGVATAIFLLVVALALFGLGLLNLRGKNGARIATWVVGGIMLCCTGFSLLSGLAGGMSMPGGETTGDMPSADEVQRRLEEALPGWVTPVSLLLGVISLLALLAALILLALPKANEFFRKPTQQWEPPMPGGNYPSQPGYPQAPGYPGASPQSAEPGYPPTPGQPPAGGPGAQPPQAGGPGHPGDQPPTDRPN
ncbi:hypothetical protein ABT008_19470 [Micromonospora sp. NPDC002389]|uniref:hypothetical protein n=1 Tax=Micromonospora sp. NPDC002389 TaxID=3154272 RepID=UPI003317C184